MSRKILTICDTDAEYARRLAGFAETVLRSCEVRLFTRQEAFQIYLEEDYSDQILMGETFLAGLPEQVRAQLPSGGTLVLTEEEEAIKGFRSACRFRSARELLELVRQQYEEEQRRELRAKETAVVGIYSPVKRCGKTSLAIALAECLARRDSVLLITLEDVCGHGAFDKAAGETGLSDLLYRHVVGSLTGDELQELGHMVNNVTVLPAADRPEDIRGGDPADVASLLRFLKAECCRRFIVVDVGDGLPDPGPVLELCDSVRMPCGTDPVSSRKTERWTEGLRRGRGDLRRKLIELRMEAVSPETLHRAAEGIAEELYE